MSLRKEIICDLTKLLAESQKEILKLMTSPETQYVENSDSEENAFAMPFSIP